MLRSPLGRGRRHRHRRPRRGTHILVAPRCPSASAEAALSTTHTIRHASCIEADHDKFDEKVSQFLNEIGEANLIGIHTIGYEHFDVGIQKILTDYGVLIVFRG